MESWLCQDDLCRRSVKSGSGLILRITNRQIWNRSESIWNTVDNSKIVICLHVDNVSVRRDVDETPVVLVQDPSKCSRLGYLCHDRHSCSRLRYFCDYCIRIACLLVFRGGKSKILLREGSVYFHGQFLDIYIIVGYSTSEHKKLGSPCPKSHGILPFFAFLK